MRIHAFSLYDRKTLVYHNPFFAVTDGAATRIVADIVADPNTQPGRHPGDFVLYRLGTYDDALGLMLPETPIQHVIDANALIPAGGGLPDPAGIHAHARKALDLMSSEGSPSAMNGG